MPISRLRCARIDSPARSEPPARRRRCPRRPAARSGARTFDAPAAASPSRSRRASSRRRARRRWRAPAADRRSRRRARSRTPRVDSATSPPARSNARTRKRSALPALQPHLDHEAPLRRQRGVRSSSTRRPRVPRARRSTRARHRQAAADDERFQIGGHGRMLDAQREAGGRRGRVRGRRRIQPDAARVKGRTARDDGHRIDAPRRCGRRTGRRRASRSAGISVGPPTSTTRATSPGAR